MTDDDLDRALGDWATTARAQAPKVTVPTEPGRRDSRTRLIAMAAAAVVVAGLAGVAVVIQRRDARPSSAAASSPSIGPTAPPGFRPVTVHGLTVDVPAAWPTNAQRCGTPTTNTVLLPLGLVALCLTPRPRGITTVEFQDGLRSDASARRFTLGGGGQARRSDRVEHGVYSTTVFVESLRVSVVISGPTRSAVDRLVGTLRIDTVDVNGCPARIDGYLELPTGRPPVRPGANQTLVPGTPTALVACRYGHGLVEGGASFGGSRAAAVARAWNAQPRGLSVTDPKSYLPSLCRNGAASRPGTDNENRFSYRVQFRYPDGPTVVVNIRLSLCGRLGASNGSYTVQRTDALIAQLVSLLGSIDSYGVVRPV